MRNSVNLLQLGTTRKYSDGYLVNSNSPILPGVVLACLGYFWFIQPCSCLFQLVAVGYGLIHIFEKSEGT